MPVPGRDIGDGGRYRQASNTLDIPELDEAYNRAAAAVEQFAKRPGTPLGQRTGHGPALSVYALWAAHAREAHHAIDADTAKVGLAHLAAR